MFERFPPRSIPYALEIGSGDGYLAHLLAALCEKLVISDVDVDKLRAAGAPPKAEIRQLDVMNLTSVFEPSSFDMVFSCGVLPVLPDPAGALREIATVLQPGGLTIHIVARPLWKVSQVLLHVPNLMHAHPKSPLCGRGVEECGDLHPRSGRGRSAERDTRTDRRSVFSRLLTPSPVRPGAGAIEELIGLRSGRWIREFRKAGLDVLAIWRGPVMSGYGFGWDRLRRLLERAGLSSELIYVARKRGAESTLAGWLPLR